MVSLEMRTRKLLNKENDLEIKCIVDTILNSEMVFMKPPITILKIANKYSIECYKSRMPNYLLSSLFVNGTTEKEYGKNKVIVVNNQETLELQRFLVALELGHYIFDFLGSKILKKTDFYTHTSNRGKIFDCTIYAQKFALELLMPESLFLRTYVKAINNSQTKLGFGDKAYTRGYMKTIFEVPGELIDLRLKDFL